MDNPLGKILERYLEPLAEGIEKRKLLVTSVFSIPYFVGFCLIASNKLMWNDELLTFYIARLPHLSSIWKALLTGAEQTPPLSYVVTRASWDLLGVSNLSTRLPEILGVWLMGLCLLVFVAKRTSFLYGFVAMLFPLVTQVFYYATEARAYGLVLAFSAMALLCWQAAAEDRRRWLALAGLTASLAAAVSSHYYAVLIPFPLMLGELVRSVRRRRIDTAIWVSLALGMTPLLLFLPLIESARSYAPHFWAKPHWMSIIYFYQRFLLTPSVLPLALVLALVMGYFAVRPTLGKKIPALDVPPHEMAAALGFVLIPVAGVVLAKTTVGAFDNRYALPAVIGISVVVGWGLFRAFDGAPAMALAVSVVLLGAVIAKDIQSYHTAVEDQSDRQATYTFLESHAEGELPIVIANPQAFVELNHTAPSELRSRLAYLADPHLGIQDTGTDDVERGVIEMKHWAGMNVQTFPSYLGPGRQFYVYSQNTVDRFTWLLPELLKAHWKLSLVGSQDTNTLYLAAPGDTRNTPPGTM